ncbi:antitoxin [Microlunatus elymi]|uniref:Antitoxin n=1 Tax=Microlunatus elymi TaxID=2596828 RepID=A0A516Q3N5_9ACTN|nr:antitoxin [Microlunatus elymi]QDP97831.1 antitoxin [Microlunatus elymi]
MRTTVTLESEVEVRLRALMKERGIGFKEAINSALRAGLDLDPVVDLEFPSYDLGRPLVDLSHASRLAAAMEDEEVLRKMSAGR